MGLLDQKREKRIMPRRILIYGIEGVGKSSFAAMADKPKFIDIEDALEDIECDPFPLAESFDEVMQAVSELYTEKHSYKTVVIDTLDWLEKLIWKEVCKDKCVTNIEDIGFSKGYKFALTYWSQFLDGLKALRRERGMTIIFVAHAKVEKFDDPENDSYDHYMPRIHEKASAIIREWCDEVLFANYKTYTRTVDEGFNRTVAKGTGTGERVVYTTKRPAYLAKNRLNLPDELPLDWRAYAEFLPGNKKSEGGKTNVKS